MATQEHDDMLLERLAGEVAALRAEQRAAQLARRYGRGIDGKDWRTVALCFVPGVTIEGSRRTLPGEEYWRRQEIDLRIFPKTMHCMHNQIVTLDGASGSVETYCVALHWTVESIARNSGPDLTLGVVYHDRVGHIDDRWLITHRKVDPSWRTGDYPSHWDRGRL